jgi:8-oxo-dGTP pyrophosphatase MutT (NUDIX family)
MYKVFFKDRTVFFRNNFLETFRLNSGLFYKYGSDRELLALVDAYYDLTEIKELFLVHNDIELVWNKFRSCFSQIEAAGGLVNNGENKFLVIYRNETWDLPKGKVDPGESIEETAVREVKEECGLNHLVCGKKITETYHTYKIGERKILKRTHWFEMHYKGNIDPVPQREENITEIKWLNEGDLDIMLKNTFPSIVEVFRAKGMAV